MSTLAWRLLSKIRVLDAYPGVPLATPCWEWTAGKVDGYGRIGLDGKYSLRVLSHRVLFELLVGPVPPGLELDHLCRNRACCNPDHLEPVTRATNVRRGKGLAANGRPFDSVDGLGRRFNREHKRTWMREYMQQRRSA